MLLQELSRVKTDGFAFTAEALLSLILFSLVLLSIPDSFETPRMQELYLLQKADDLLKVWSIERNFSREEMLSDIAFVFPDNCVILQIDGLPVNSCVKTSSFFPANAELFDGFLREFEVRLTVYY